MSRFEGHIPLEGTPIDHAANAAAINARTVSDPTMAACLAMRASDMIMLGEASARWPNVTRSEEHRALEAAGRLGTLLGMHPGTIWERMIYGR